jgi:hypothetical protein
MGAAGSRSIGALARGALAVGATAIGALAIGALAIQHSGAEVGRLHVRELVVEQEQPPSQGASAQPS